MSACVETMFSVREKPWHYEMTKDVTKIIQEAPTSFEALVAAGLDWEVQPQKIFLEGSDVAIPNAAANVRSSDGKVLGIVTDRYKIVQNTDAFAFTDTLIGGDVRYETAGSLMGGRKIWLLAKMPTTTILGDDVEPYLCFTNTHDGSGAVRCMMTPVRVVCNNTLNLAISGAKRSWSVKHTGDINRKIAEAKETLGLAEKYMEKLDETAERLADVKIDMEQVMNIVKGMFPYKDTDSECVKRNAKAAIDTYQICYLAPDLVQYRGTAWGAVNAMADMVAHSEPNRRTANYAENNWNRIMGGHTLVDQMVTAVAHA